MRIADRESSEFRMQLAPPLARGMFASVYQSLS